MAYRFLGPDRVEDSLRTVLQSLAAGEPPHRVEVAQVDVKEEPGRRDRSGTVLAGSTRSDVAARYLAGEMACLANTPGGGAIVLGVADDGTMIGTELDVAWLRHRIYELTEQRLTVAVREVDLDGTRLLALSTLEAIEPIRFDGRVRWRVDDNCVDIDPTAWPPAGSNVAATTGLPSPQDMRWPTRGRSGSSSRGGICAMRAMTPQSNSPRRWTPTSCAASTSSTETGA